MPSLPSDTNPPVEDDPLLGEMEEIVGERVFNVTKKMSIYLDRFIIGDGSGEKFIVSFPDGGDTLYGKKDEARIIPLSIGEKCTVANAAVSFSDTYSPRHDQWLSWMRTRRRRRIETKIQEAFQGVTHEFHNDVIKIPHKTIVDCIGYSSLVQRGGNSAYKAYAGGLRGGILLEGDNLHVLGCKVTFRKVDEQGQL